MKNAILIITTFVLLLGCASKRTTTTTEQKSYSRSYVDSLTEKNKEITKNNVLLLDSVFELKNILKTKETTITKAAVLETEIKSLCDSLGNLKDFSQSLGNDTFKLKLTAANGKLKVISEQLTDLVSTKETLISENIRLESTLKSLESKHSQEVNVLKNKILEVESLKETDTNKETVRVVWSKWTYIFFATTLILLFVVVWLLKDKVLSLIH